MGSVFAIDATHFSRPLSRSCPSLPLFPAFFSHVSNPYSYTYKHNTVRLDQSDIPRFTARFLALRAVAGPSGFRLNGFRKRARSSQQRPPVEPRKPLECG